MKALIVAAMVLMPTLLLAETENEALLRVQNRNAAVLGNLVDQTPQYQDGHTLRVEAARQQEQATAERNRRWKAEGEAASSSGSRGLSGEDQARVNNLNSDLPRFCAKGPVLQGGDEERTDRRSVIRVRVVAQYIAEERR